MDKKFDVVGIGTGCTDIMHTKKGTMTFSGGSTANTVYALQKIGMKTGFVGTSGSDENGRAFVESMQNAGVDISRLKTLRGKTATCHIKVTRKKRKILSYENWRPLSRLDKESKEYMRNAGAVFINLSNKIFNDVATFCTKNNIRLFVSMHEYNQRANPFTLINGHKTDILFTGAHRMKMLKKHFKDIRNNGTIIVLTKGREGCEVWKKDEYISYKGLTLSSVDPTGAGDAFAAGFVFGALRGWNIERVCDFANFMGAVATTDFGARTRLATFEDYEIYRQSGLKKLIA